MCGVISDAALETGDLLPAGGSIRGILSFHYWGAQAYLECPLCRCISAQWAAVAPPPLTLSERMDGTQQHANMSSFNYVAVPFADVT